MQAAAARPPCNHPKILSLDPEGSNLFSPQQARHAKTIDPRSSRCGDVVRILFPPHLSNIFIATDSCTT